MSRRPLHARAGPPSATLLRRLKAGDREGSLAILVEVWGLDEPRYRAAVEQRLASGMAAMVERRAGSLTARLRVALVAGDRWLRRVIEQEAGHEAPAAAAGMLGAGASLLFVTGEEAYLAQAGPAVAYAIAPGGEAEARRYPPASPWLRRGVERLADDGLWPPLGMSRSGELEVHLAHWPFPPGAAALLAPSRAAELLSRERVLALLTGEPELLQRRLDEQLPGDLPLVYLAQPLPAGLSRPAPPPAPAAEPEPSPPAAPTVITAAPALAPSPLGDLAAELDAPADGEAEEAGAADGDLPPERWVRWLGPPAEATVASAPPSAPPVDTTTRFDAIDFDTGLLPAPALQAAPSIPPSAPAAAPPALQRRAARLLLALLPQRASSGAEALEIEAARLTAALALALPLGAVILTMMMQLRGLPAWPAADTPTRPAAAVPAAAPSRPDVRRLTDIAPLANFPGEANHPRQLVVAPPYAYVLDEVGQVVHEVRWDLANPATPSLPLAVLQTGQFLGTPPPVGGLEALAYVPPPRVGVDAAGDGAVVALDNADKLWRLREGLAPMALERPALPVWTGVESLAGYEGRLYALDRTSGQVYRYEAVGGEFPRFRIAGESWLSAPEDFREAIELAVDGAIYVRFAGGSIRKYADSVPQPFDITGLPDGATSLGEPMAIFASPLRDGGPLLVADRAGGRIWVLSATGAYQEQLLLPASPQTGNGEGRFSSWLSDVHWDPESGLLYVLDGMTLYRASWTPGVSAGVP